MALHGIEHLGLVVDAAESAARWLSSHAGLELCAIVDDGNAAFLRCPQTRAVVELISRADISPLASRLDHPLQLHVALRSDDFDRDRDRLVSAGAEFVEMNIDTPDARVGILRSPNGIFLQLAQRKKMAFE